MREGEGWVGKNFSISIFEASKHPQTTKKNEIIYEVFGGNGTKKMSKLNVEFKYLDEMKKVHKNENFRNSEKKLVLFASW